MYAMIGLLNEKALLLIEEFGEPKTRVRNTIKSLF